MNDKSASHVTGSYTYTTSTTTTGTYTDYSGTIVGVNPSVPTEEKYQADGYQMNGTLTWNWLDYAHPTVSYTEQSTVEKAVELAYSYVMPAATVEEEPVIPPVVIEEEPSVEIEDEVTPLTPAPEEIEDEVTPLTSAPEEEIPDDPTPLATLDEVVEIDGEAVPLAAVPQTGVRTGGSASLLGVLAAAAAVLLRRKHRAE